MGDIIGSPARVEDLEDFIDRYYHQCVMEDSNINTPPENPGKRKKTDSSNEETKNRLFSIL